MELKRIIARDSRAANEKAIQMFGQDVLIISSHKVDNQIELVVAVETSPTATPPLEDNAFKPSTLVQEAPSQLPRTVPAQAFSRVFEEHMVSAAEDKPVDSGTSSEHDMVMDALTALSRRVVNQPVGTAVAESMAAAPAPAATAAVSAPSVSVAPAAVTPVNAAPEMVHDFRRSQETVELLRQEMAALRQEFALSRQMAVWQSGLGLSPEIEQFWNELSELGMPARLRSLMLDSVRSVDSIEEARGMVFQLLADALKRPEVSAPQQGVHALFGPSGAGKTLMVVRLAKQACATMEPEQQAIISYCDQRPGAWSQLQVMAAQTGVECYRAKDAQTLKLLLDELSGRQAIWIDTPGTDFLSHAQDLRNAVPDLNMHAVLPVDASVTSVQKVLESAAQTWSSLMLSKLDEAAHPWPLIQGLCNNPLGISLVGQGVSLSNSPIAFAPDQLVDMALSPLAALPKVPPKEKPSRQRLSPLESPVKVAVKNSRKMAKVLNA